MITEHHAKRGWFYRHFKGDVYQVLATDAHHTETGEEVVVYRRVRDETVWVRPTESFNESLPDGSPRFRRLCAETG